MIPDDGRFSMSSQYPMKILAELGILIILFGFASFGRGHETVVIESQDGEQEIAFPAPAKGVPDHILKLYCANVKLRLYWNVFRPEVKNNLRKGVFLRRMARFAKHIYPDIRSVDRPFNASRLSIIDEFFAVEDPLDKEENGEISDGDEDENSASTRKKWNMKQFASMINCKINRNPECKKKKGKDYDSDSDLEDNNPDVDLEDSSVRVETVKKWVKRYAKKFAIGIYTRWRTMWWLMMPCLFTKYYLWDPALDEFTKLKRSLVMYPDFQTIKLQDLDCLPTKYFQRILGTCKILNPLMMLDFGELSLDKMTRFKSDT